MNWDTITRKEQQKEYFGKLYDSVNKEYKEHACYPPYEKIFNAIETTQFEDVKVVIIGQDPYHEPNQAMGLAFSVEPTAAIPKSLQNIYKELQNELGCYIPNNGDLTAWAKQGVLLLNTILSVRAHDAASHSNLGWENFTNALIDGLNEKTTPVVFMLWGRYAREKRSLIKNPKHLILECSHPSPFSASYGFFGCGHFKTCNEFLAKNNLSPIDWQIKNI